jgi:hypothetical protein
MPSVAEVSAYAHPSAFAAPARGTDALSSLKGTAQTGTPAAAGPSANIGQTITIKGGAIAEGVASFPGYNGTDVTSTLTKVKPGKKAKAVVPNLAITGDVGIIPTGGEETGGLRLQIVPTLTNLSATNVSPGDALTINGTGFAADVRVVFPGVAEPVAPQDFDNDSAVAVVPEGVQKGKLKVTTAGGTSNTLKLKIAAGLANKALATDTATGLILATDDMANTVSAIDPASGAVLRSVTLQGEPTGIRVESDARRAYVRDDAGYFATIDLDTWEVGYGAPATVSRLVSFFEPSLDVDRGGIRYGAYAKEPDGSVDAVSRFLRLGAGVEAMAMTPDGARAVVVAGDHGRLFVVDVANGSLLRTIEAGHTIEGVTVGVDGRAYTMNRATGELLAFPLE